MMKHEFTFSQSPSEERKCGELNQLIDLGTCGVHTTHIAFKQKLQIGNTKNWCHLWAEYSMKHLVGVLITKLLLMLQRRSTSCNILFTGGLKMMLQKSKGDMVKNYWSSILLATIMQKQTAWASKTWSQHQLWSFMQGCQKLSCSSQTFIFRGNWQKNKLISGSFPN